VTIGPVIENGFFYDFARKEPFTSDDLKKIEKKMSEIVDKDVKTRREVWERNKAISHFKEKGETYKAELIEAIPENEKTSEKFKNLIDGLNMVQKEFSTILSKHGVNKIDAINTKFDHNLHQAMVELEDDSVDEGTVVQEMQSGYTMHDRLLRPSMVAVSKKHTKKDNNKKND